MFKLNKKYNYAIVGASNNKNKYGYKVTKNMLDKNYNVIPVNLREKEILGLKCYKSILDIDNKPDVVIFIVPPQITEEVLKDVKSLNINKVWMQPGSDSKKAIKFCINNKIECIHNQCVMLQ